MRMHLIKIKMRLAWAHFVDNLQDLINMTWPIFVVSGILVASLKFWWAILP